MNTKFTDYLSVLKCILLIPSLLIVLSACSSNENEDNSEIESMQKEIDELKSSLDKKEDEQQDNEEAMEEEKVDQSKESNTDNNRDEVDLNQEKTGELDIDKSNLTLVPDTIFNTYPDSVVKLYQDDSGNEYFEENYDGNAKFYHKDAYYFSPEVWEPFIQGYDQAVQDFYNLRLATSNPRNVEIMQGTNNDLYTMYVTEDLYYEFAEKMGTFAYENHSSSIEFISAEKYNDQDVIITAKRTYSHASGSGQVTNKYYVNILEKRVTFYKSVN